MTAPRGCRIVAGLGVLLLGALSPASAVAAPSEPSAPVSTASPAPSASRSYAPDPSGFGLMVSPTRLTVSPRDLGTTQRVTVVNRGTAPMPVTVQKRNFTAKSDGSLSYAQDAPYAAADWLTVSPMSFTVPPGSEQVVTADVTVPVAADHGDHQVAVIFLVPSTGGEGNVRINRGVGVPAFITVPGPVDDSVRLNDLRAPRFVAWGAFDVQATVQNVGTVHRDFRGPTALPIRGVGTDGQFADFTVTRGATREISGRWEPPLACVCQLSVTVTNADGADHTRTVRVVVFPWPIVLALGGALLVTALLVRAGRRAFDAKVLAAVAVHRSSGDSESEVRPRGPDA